MFSKRNDSSAQQLLFIQLFKLNLFYKLDINNSKNLQI